MAFGGHFSGRGPKINPFFEKLLFFCPVGRGRVLLKAATDSETSAFTAGAMFLGAVASTGETSPPIWGPNLVP